MIEVKFYFWMRMQFESKRLYEVREYLNANDIPFRSWNPLAGLQCGPDNYAMHFIANFESSEDFLVFKLKFPDLKYGQNSYR